jgi:hypothetical protein
MDDYEHYCFCSRRAHSTRAACSKTITTQAQKLLQLIEEDLIEFSEANGVDMSRVRAEINKHYFE